MQPYWRRCATLLFFSLASFGQDPRDPDGLTRLVESSPTCDFNALWDSLGLTQPWEFGRVDPQHARRPCRISRVFEGDGLETPQRILVLYEPNARRAFYLRYVREQGAWRFQGAHMAESKNYPHRHEAVRAPGDRVYFRVSTQGASGSDIDSELEEWFDLARPEFKPVLALPVNGYDLRYGFGISRRVRAIIHPSDGSEDRQILADVDVRLALRDRAVGHLDFRAIYAPDETGTMRLTNVAGAGSMKAFESIFWIGEGGPSNEVLIPYAFSGLRALALEAKQKKDRDLAGALHFFLSQMKPDVPQVRELKAILR